MRLLINTHMHFLHQSTEDPKAFLLKQQDLKKNQSKVYDLKNFYLNICESKKPQMSYVMCGSN